MSKLFTLVFMVSLFHTTFSQHQNFKDSLTNIILKNVSKAPSGVPGLMGSGREKTNVKVRMLDSLTTDLDNNGSLDYIFSVNKKGFIESNWYEVVLLKGDTINSIYSLPYNSRLFQLDLVSTENNRINAVLSSEGGDYTKKDSVELAFVVEGKQLVEYSTLNCPAKYYIDSDAFIKETKKTYLFNAFYELERREILRFNDEFTINLIMDGCESLKLNYQMKSKKTNKLDSLSLKAMTIDNIGDLISISTPKYKKILKIVKKELEKLESSSFNDRTRRTSKFSNGEYSGTIQVVSEEHFYTIKLIVFKNKQISSEVGFDWERIKRRI